MTNQEAIINLKVILSEIIECEESYDSFFDTVAEGDAYNNYIGEQQYSPI